MRKSRREREKERHRVHSRHAAVPLELRPGWSPGSNTTRFFFLFLFFSPDVFGSGPAPRPRLRHPGPDPAISRARGQPPPEHRVPRGGVGVAPPRQTPTAISPAPRGRRGAGGPAGRPLPGMARLVSGVPWMLSGRAAIQSAKRSSFLPCDEAMPLPCPCRSPTASRSLACFSPARPGPARLRPPGTAPLLAASPPRGRRPLTPRRAPLGSRCHRPPGGCRGPPFPLRAPPALALGLFLEGRSGGVGCLLFLRATRGVCNSPLSSAGGGLNKCLLCWDRWPAEGSLSP